MKSVLPWHPRHPDRQRPSRREDVAQYGDPAEPVFLDEAEVTREQVVREFAERFKVQAEAALLDEAVDAALQLPEKERLRVAWPTGPLLDPAATARAGERIAQDRRELAALQDVGLMPREDERG